MISLLRLGLAFATDDEDGRLRLAWNHFALG
jgi:hypothetical protein